jgi:soluble lytic murein transglycosylase-like protein
MEADVEATPAQDEGLSNPSPASDGISLAESIPFHGIIIQVAGRYEVDPHLIRAIILAESNYNPKALSKKGARGLMQLMPSTAKALGVQNIYDPEENIDGGVRYFRSLLDRFGGDVQLALAAYNAGSRHVRNYDGIPPFKATQHYIKKVLHFHEKFKTENVVGSRRLA